MGFRLSLCDIPTLIRNMLCKGSVHHVLPSLSICMHGLVFVYKHLIIGGVRILRIYCVLTQ